MTTNFRLLSACFLFCLAGAPGQAQVLFDATKAEMAGNADWVIDADAHDLRVDGGDGSGVRGTGSAYPQSNPQRVPTPAAGGITSATKETYWQGALSAWAVALAKNGQTVIETLPVFTTTTGTTRSWITYKDGTNAQDLANYRLCVVCEPNILFTAAEKTALLSYVRDGGTLFLVSDHSGSDRNNDGNDAVSVWNDLFTSNSVAARPFGFTFNQDDVSPTKEFADTTSTDPLTHGAAGTITQFNYADGATMTISDATVAHAAVWQTSSKSSSQVMALYGAFGMGRFAAIGDSSPCDDGTGDSGDTLYDGWDDGGGNNGQLIVNASLWLLASNPPVVTTGAGSALSANGATLNGTVTTGGGTASVLFQYGPTTAYSSSTAATGTTGAAATAVAGLSAATTYHFRAAASSLGGTGYGADATFTTPAGSPQATTTAATAVASTQGTLNGSVNPQGTVAAYHFEFGTTTAYGFTSPAVSAGAGNVPVPGTLPVVGLAAGTTFHYRLVVTTATSTIYGADATFTTGAFVDSDGDGLPDDYETAHGLNPNNAADGVADADGDGVSNLQEFLAGTDPKNARDLFRATASVPAGSADVTVQFPTVFGKRYTVERTGSLAAPGWTAVGAVLNGNGTPWSVTDAGALGGAQTAGFYRVRIVP